MSPSRRSFVSSAAGAAALSAFAGRAPLAARPARRPAARPDFDPWLEIDAGALVRNARAVTAHARRPVLAVIKNHGYGLGHVAVARALGGLEEIRGFAVVTGAAAAELRDAGVEKPILLMGRVEDAEALDLAARGVRLTTIDASTTAQLEGVARRLGRPVPIHAYLDTGMNRVGLSHRRAERLLGDLASSGAARLEGTFTGLAEDEAFDPEQLRRFRDVTDRARGAGVELGLLHAASSHGLFFRPGAGFDMVRPGLVLYGAYPAGAREREEVELEPAFRLRARVVRVERLEAGDGVSYGRQYVATKPTWIATLPVGHADGYPRRAVEGGEVWIAGEIFPVIGAVSASHTIVELGDEPRAAPGDDAILVGPDHPAIHPNELARRAGISVYDVLMHLSARLPRIIV